MNWFFLNKHFNLQLILWLITIIHLNEITFDCLKDIYGNDDNFIQQKLTTILSKFSSTRSYFWLEQRMHQKCSQSHNPQKTIMPDQTRPSKHRLTPRNHRNQRPSRNPPQLSIMRPGVRPQLRDQPIRGVVMWPLVIFICLSLFLHY